MHHHSVALLLHPPQQFPHPALTYPHPLSRFSLRHFAVSCPFQPFQPVPLLLAHRDSFHLSASRLSIGTFYFGQLGTFHFGATALAMTGMPVSATKSRRVINVSAR